MTKHLSFLLIFNMFLINTVTAIDTVHKQIQFSHVDEENMQNFEEEIAYFYGVKNPARVSSAYINALKKLEKKGDLSSIELAVIPHLQEAYAEVALQNGWDFDVYQAAQIELKIILANAQQSSTETVEKLMTQLYSLVFHSDVPQIHHAAMLRTFLYRYKIDLQKNGQGLSVDDKKLMLSISQASKNLLNSIKEVN